MALCHGCTHFPNSVVHLLLSTYLVISGDSQVFLGHRGGNVTLPCEGFSTKPTIFKLEWWKLSSWDNLKDFDVAAHMKLKSGFSQYSDKYEDRAHVSPKTGELSIFNFKRDDEGLYQCIMEGNMETSTIIHLKLYGG